MIEAMITGKLVTRPEARASTSGKTYVRCRLQAHDGDSNLMILAVAFAKEPCDVLQALDVGAAVCVTGSMKVGVWTSPAGETRPNLSLVIDAVMTTYERTRRAKAVGEARQQARDRHTHHEVDQRHGDGLDDGAPLNF